jgi:hypothetical protein
MAECENSSCYDSDLRELANRGRPRRENSACRCCKCPTYPAALGTSARTNQNGIRKAKTIPNTGSVTAKNKAIATHASAISGDAMRVFVIVFYVTRIMRRQMSSATSGAGVHPTSKDDCEDVFAGRLCCAVPGCLGDEIDSDG